ncbi:hypothetical protein Tco_0085700 [Tanacetum coccineum]
MKEIGKSSGIDDEVVQDQRQRDNNNLQDERQDQPKEEDVKPRRCKRTRIEKLFGLDFVSFMVENEPTSYREALITCQVRQLHSKPSNFKIRLSASVDIDGTNLILRSEFVELWCSCFVCDVRIRQHENDVIIYCCFADCIRYYFKCKLPSSVCLVKARVIVPENLNDNYKGKLGAAMVESTSSEAWKVK